MEFSGHIFTAGVYNRERVAEKVRLFLQKIKLKAENTEINDFSIFQCN